MTLLISRVFSYRITLFLVFIILLPNMLVDDVESHLDASWRIGLALANLKGFVFGKDIVFTYGPLHFLITKVGVLYSYKWITFLFELATIACTTFIFSRVYKLSEHPLRGLFLVAVAFLISDRSCELYLLLIFLYAVYQVLMFQKLSYSWLMVLISTLTFFIKINFGFVNFLIMFVVFLYISVKNYKSAPILLLYTVVYIASILVLSKALHVDIVAYLSSGLYIINDYNDAMFLPFSFHDPVDCVSILLVLVFGVLFLSNISFFLQSDHRMLSLVYCFYYFLLFKNGFVRIDHHIYIFIFNSLSIYVLLYIWKQDLKFFKQCFTASVLLGFMSIALGWANAYMLHQDSGFNSTFLKNKLNVWRYPLDLVKSTKYKSEFNEINDEMIPVNPSYLKAISTHSVDVIPQNISLMYRYQLQYNPRPVFQSYSAYSLYLDSLNSKKYTSVSAPEFLLFFDGTIDDRVSFWDESVTKKSIYDHYELFDTLTHPDSSYILFRQRKSPLKHLAVDVANVTTKTNTWIQVPADTSNLYLYADVKYSVMGKLRRLLLQAPMLRVAFNYSDGSQKTYRCIPKILQTGVLINKGVTSNQDAYYFFNREHNRLKKIVSFKLIEGSGFESEVSCKFVKTMLQR